MAFDPLTAGLQIGGKLIDHFFPDKDKQAEQRADAQFKLLELAQRGDLAVITAQTEINKAEAGNPNWFVAGWRPYVGWICGTGLAVQFIVRPFAMWGAGLHGHVVDFPSLDMGTLMTLLTGMLGLGAMRTFEKQQGAEANR